MNEWMTCPDCNGQGGQEFQRRGYCAADPDAWGWSKCGLCMGTGEVYWDAIEGEDEK